MSLFFLPNCRLKSFSFLFLALLLRRNHFAGSPFIFLHQSRRASRSLRVVVRPVCSSCLCSHSSSCCLRLCTQIKPWRGSGFISLWPSKPKQEVMETFRRKTTEPLCFSEDQMWSRIFFCRNQTVSEPLLEAFYRLRQNIFLVIEEMEEQLSSVRPLQACFLFRSACLCTFGEPSVSPVSPVSIHLVLMTVVGAEALPGFTADLSVFLLLHEVLVVNYAVLSTVTRSKDSFSVEGVVYRYALSGEEEDLEVYLYEHRVVVIALNPTEWQTLQTAKTEARDSAACRSSMWQWSCF